MIAIKTATDCLNVYRLADKKVSYLGIASELVINQCDVLLQDYDEYLAPAKRMHPLIHDLAKLQVEPSVIYSPYEVIGAYLKEEQPGINGEIQVLDMEPAWYHTFTIEFINGRYTLKKDAKLPVKKETGTLFQDCLNMTAGQVSEFDLFLNTIYKNGKPYGYEVWEAIQEYERTGEKLDFLFPVFGVKEWAHITISQLIDCKEQLLRSAGIDVKKAYRTVGLLGGLFSKEYNARDRQANIGGAEYLYRHSNEFYAPLTSAVAMGAYCYPDVVKMPLYAAGSLQEEYKKTKQVQLYGSGELIFYRDNHQLAIKTGANETTRVDLEIQVDGNQNLVVSVGKQTYLIP